jgi:hypothetical protein
MEKLSFEELVKSMEGADTTKGWDVLVSYDLDQVNKLLAQAAARLIDISQLEVSTTYNGW